MSQWSFSDTSTSTLTSEAALADSPSAQDDNGVFSLMSGARHGGARRENVTVSTSEAMATERQVSFLDAGCSVLCVE
jgi:hypothetical protein